MPLLGYIDIFQVLSDAFPEPGDFLDHITKQEDLTDSPTDVGKRVRPLLTCLLRMKSPELAVTQANRLIPEPLSVIFPAVKDSPANRVRAQIVIPIEVLTEREETAGIQIPTDGSLDIFDDAIGMARDMLAATPSPEVIQLLQPLLTSFLKIKSRGSLVTKTTERIREPQLVISPPANNTRAANSNPTELEIRTGSVLEVECYKTGDIDCRRRAIEVLQETVESYPTVDGTRLIGPYLLINWKMQLASIAFDHVGQATEQEIEMFGRLKVAAIFKMIFDETTDMNMLNETITHLEGLVLAILHPDPQTPEILGGLGHSLHLDTVFEATPESVTATIPNDTEVQLLVQLLRYLAILYFWRFERLGDLEDIDEAINAIDDAEAETPPNGIVPHMLRYLGVLFSRRFDIVGDMDDIDNAIQATEEAIAATPINDIGANLLHNSGIFHFKKFVRFGDLGDLAEAIKATEQAVATNPPNETKVHILCYLATYRAISFQQSDSLSDLDKAITAGEALIAATPPNGIKVGILHDLGRCRFERFVRLGASSDLDKAIQQTGEAAAATSPNETKPDILCHLATYYLWRFQSAGASCDLDKAIEVQEKAVAATSPGDPKYVIRSWNLCRTYRWRLDRLWDLEDLDNAIRAIHKAVTATKSQNSKILTDWGYLLSVRFEHFGNLEDINEAIKGFNNALAFDRMSAEILTMLGVALLRRFERLGDNQDIHNAIKSTEEAITASSPDNRNQAFVLENLSTMLQARVKRLGGAEDLVKAMKAAEDAAKARRKQSSEASGSIQLSDIFEIRGERFGDLRDHDEAIKIAEESLAEPQEYCDSPALYLNNLSVRFSTRFKRLGALDDLSKAIEAGERAVAVTPPDHITRPTVLSNLSTNLHSRFHRLGTPGDLERAIQIGEDVVAATPPESCDRASVLGNLGTMFFARYGLFRAVDDLQKAIEVSEQAVAVISLDYLGRANMLRNLSIHIYTRFQHFHTLDDLDRAITIGQEAVAAFPPDHPDLASGLIQLGKMFESRGMSLETSSAIPLEDSFLLGLSLPHSLALPLSLAMSLSLGYDLVLLCQQSNLAFQQTLDLYLAAWHCQSSPPYERLRAASAAALHLVLRSRWEQARSLLADAIKLLPVISSQVLGRDDQESMLSSFTKLVPFTFSVALQAGSTASHCLSLLELSHGIILSLTINCRSDLTDLQARYPEVFEKFNCLRIEIDSPLVNNTYEPGRSTNSDSDRWRDEQKRRRRVQAIQELHESLASIHQLPGFERFQLPPGSEDLMAMAAEGPIVIFNSTRFRSDAIIVTASSIKSLALPRLVFAEVGDRIVELKGLARGPLKTAASRNRVMNKALLWLWDMAVEPVFEELGLDAAMKPELDDSKLPRVWWIGIGQLSSAPFHAAGDHSRGSTRNTLSRAISSYIPTIKALSYTRQKKLALDTNPRMLLVAMPTTPDTPAIPGVLATLGTRGIAGTPPIPATPTTPAVPRTYGVAATYRSTCSPGTTSKKWAPLKGVLKEVDEILAVVRERSATVQTQLDFQTMPLVSILSSPSVALVLKELPAYRVIHLACHGVSDPKSPSNSHLLLHDDNNALEPGKLTVHAIANMNIKNAQIAYLSACSTADNASIALATESIHIASAFQLAGFSHVLATLWPANDDACRKVAVEFYRLLFKGQSAAGHSVVSLAFHQAVKKLRSEKLSQPTVWAAFIHTGA